MSGPLTAHCATCGVIVQCKHAFGDYWVDKSHGGIGCTCLFPAKAVAPVRREEPVRREPWESKVFTTRGREGGVFAARKRKGARARQGVML